MDAARSGQGSLQTTPGRVTSPTPPGPQGSPATTRPQAPADQSLAQTQPLVQLRQSPPVGRSGPNQPALQTQASTAQQNRGTLLSDPNQIVRHELARDPELQRRFDRLSPQQQQSFQGMLLSQVAEGTTVNTQAAGLGMMGGAFGMGASGGAAANLSQSQQDALKEQAAAGMTRNNLYTLLRSDQLNSSDSKGRSLLTNLEALRTQELAPGIDRNQLFRGAVNDVAMASFASNQGGPAVAEELKRKLATDRPSEYVGVVGSLASPEGKASLGNVALSRNDRAAGSEFQSVSSRLFTHSMSERAAGHELFRQEVSDNPQVRQRYGALSSGDKTRFQEIYRSTLPTGNSLQAPPPAKDFMNPTPAERDALNAFFEGQHNAHLAREARGSLNTLLADNKLGNKDSTGNTLLSNLEGLRTQSFAREGEHRLDGGQILNEVLVQTARPGSISQGNRGTCTVTTMEHLQATREPSEYVRVMKGLTSATGSVRLRNGDTLNRDTGVVAPDDSGRSAASRVYQASMMEYANGPDQDYRNEAGGHFDRRTGTPLLDDRGKLRDGLPMQNLGQVSTAVMEGRFQYRDGSMRGANPNTITREIQGALADQKSVQVGMRWNRDPNDRDGYHALSVYRMDDQYVYLRNPWGAGETGHTDPNTGVVRQALPPDSRTPGGSRPPFLGPGEAPDPTLPTGEAGTLRMKREDFYANLDSYLVQRDEPKTPLLLPVPFVPGGFVPFFNPFR